MEYAGLLVFARDRCGKGKAFASSRDDFAVLVVAPISAKARMFAISISRPRLISAFTTRLWSSTVVSTVSSSAMADQSRAAKYLRKRS